MGLKTPTRFTCFACFVAQLHGFVILFLMAVAISESRFFGRRFTQRLIGQCGLPYTRLLRRWLLELGNRTHCKEIGQFRKDILGICDRS